MKLKQIYEMRLRLKERSVGGEDELEAYADKHALGELSWEGSGDMGEAYTTENDTILKVTSDDTELEYAKMLVGKKLDNVVDIYDVEGSIIHMEYLDTGHIDDLYFSAMEYSEHGAFDDIDIDEHEDINDELKDFILGVQDGMFQLQHNGVNNLDLKHDNIGRKANGKYAIFDMSSAKQNMGR
jgi:hypothetical protein